jgi:phosphonate transport system substrate-binding protein
MKTIKKRPLWLALLALIAGVAQAAEAPLVLGVFPYVSRGQLMEFHAPLKQYLEQQLQRPVDMVTAPNFVEFMERTRKGDYDLVLTAPHLGRLAEVRDGYVRVAKTAHHVYGIFLARQDSGIRTIADLKGKTVMIAQPVSIVYQLATEELRRHGLEPGRNVTVITALTHNNSLYAPMRHESDASVTGLVLWNTAEANVRAAEVEIGRTPGVPGFMLMASKRLAPALIERTRAAVFAFGKTPEGKAYLAATEFNRFEKIDDKTMKQLDPYTRILTERAP